MPLPARDHETHFLGVALGSCLRRMDCRFQGADCAERVAQHEHRSRLRRDDGDIRTAAASLRSGSNWRNDAVNTSAARLAANYRPGVLALPVLSWARAWSSSPTGDRPGYRFYVASLNPPSRRSQHPSWFQLAKVRVTSLRFHVAEAVRRSRHTITRRAGGPHARCETPAGTPAEHIVISNSRRS